MIFSSGLSATIPTNSPLGSEAILEDGMADTPMEVFVPNLAVLKNQYEISQCFYLFEGEEMITIHEAYRFLSIKWREKQLSQEKKQKDNETETTCEPRSGSERSKGHKLLVKKRRQPGTKLKLS